MAAKFFVWGEGVWREVDVASGCVSGWRRRARFVFVRRGRLQVARRRSVLRALRALAAGQPGAAADGPRLQHRSKTGASHSHRRRSPPPAPQPAPAPCDHHHCCAHFNGYNNHDKVARPLPAPPAPPAPAAHVREASTQCGRSDAGTSTERAFAISVNHKLNPAPTATSATSAPGLSSEDELLSTYTRAPVPATEINALFGKPPPATATTLPATTDKKLTPVNTQADDSADDKPEQRRKRTRASAKEEATSAEERAPRGAGERAACKELIISEAHVAALRGFVARTRASALARYDADDAYKRALFYAINPLVELQRCARLERLLREHHAAALPHFAARLGLAPAPAAPAPAPARALRRRPGPASRHTQRTADADTDKENKDNHTSQNKERSEPVGASKNAAEARSVTSEPVLRPRATRLRVSGRSNTDSKEVVVIPTPQTNGIVRDPPREKRRAAAAPVQAKKKAVIHSDDSDAGSAAGDVRPAADAVRPAAGGVKPAAGAVRPVAGAVRPVAGAVRPAADAVRPAAGGVGLAAGAVRPPPAGTHVISKRASASGAKEYSNLEDHAIVAWLSAGSRASLVNGNRVWRELQEQYERLTGCARSWHSLRNRYLRYILPALGALRLPPAEVSRLRAAAATGAIKAKHRAAMLQELPRGAASRRPRVASVAADDVSDGPSSQPQGSGRKDTGRMESRVRDTSAKESRVRDTTSKESRVRDTSAKDESSKAESRSPRYSEVTRRFASRRRVLPPSSSSSSSSPSRSPVLAATHSRKLFNPNANV